jgi:hypothetical protein
MIRVQAFITAQSGRNYTVEAHAEGIAKPFVFNISANSDKDAAMEAIRRVEALDAAAVSEARKH